MDNLTNQSVAALLYMPATSSQHSSILLAELVADGKKTSGNFKAMPSPDIYQQRALQQLLPAFCIHRTDASSQPLGQLSHRLSINTQRRHVIAHGWQKYHPGCNKAPPSGLAKNSAALLGLFHNFISWAKDIKRHI